MIDRVATLFLNIKLSVGVDTGVDASKEEGSFLTLDAEHKEHKKLT